MFLRMHLTLVPWSREQDILKSGYEPFAHTRGYPGVCNQEQGEIETFQSIPCRAKREQLRFLMSEVPLYPLCDVPSRG